jgi:hypothetical protein
LRVYFGVTGILLQFAGQGRRDLGDRPGARVLPPTAFDSYAFFSDSSIVLQVISAGSNASPPTDTSLAMRQDVRSRE